MARKLGEKYPPHLRGLVSNVEEVDRLLKIHVDLTGTGPGRRHVEVLNKSGIVLLVACWEAYVEDLAKAAFDALMAGAAEPKVFPNSVLVGASNPLRKDEDERRVWELAGEGWKAVLQSRRDELLDRYIGKMSTPSSEKVDELFEKLIGLKEGSSCWRWKGTSADAARARLARIIRLRGEIAHRVKATGAVHRELVLQSGYFICRLAACMSNHVRQHIHGRTSAYPWIPVVYRLKKPAADAAQAQAGPHPASGS